MKFAWFYVGLVVIALSSCTERTICPAYQSAFIHDEDALTARFSYFQEDSTPKIRDVEKNRYLIVGPVNYRKRIREMNTIPMVDVYPVKDDSVEFDQDDLMFAERDVIDSAAMEAADSAKIHPGLVGPFNTDQELYMYYLRKILILPDVRADLEEAAEKEEERKKQEEEIKEEEDGKKKKKGIFSIFKRKKKEEVTEEEKEEEPPIIFDEDAFEEEEEKENSEPEEEDPDDPDNNG